MDRPENQEREDAQRIDENQTFEPFLMENQNPLASLKIDSPDKPLNIDPPQSNPSFSVKVQSKMPIVDKTGFLYNLVRRPGAYLAIGPKKFGKTFHLSTIEAIFKEGQKWWETNCKDLDIVKIYHFTFPTRPVLKLDFHGVVGFEQFKVRVRECLLSLLKEFALQEKFTHYFQSEGQTISRDDVMNLFETVIQEVAETAGKGIVLLIDEYDQPIIQKAEENFRNSGSQDLQALTKDAQIQEMVRFLEILLMRIKSLRVFLIREKNDCLIEFVYVTGTVSICQGDFFSGCDLVDLRDGRELSELFDYTAEDAARLSLGVPMQKGPSMLENFF